MQYHLHGESGAVSEYNCGLSSAQTADSPLYRLLQSHFDRFEQVYEYVFSIPIILRKFFLYNRKLLSNLCRCAADSLAVFLRTALNLEDGILGAVMTIQTFGDYAKWRQHIHAIVADGLFRRSGVFYVMPKISVTPLAEMFRAKGVGHAQKGRPDRRQLHCHDHEMAPYLRLQRG